MTQQHIHSQIRKSHMATPPWDDSATLSYEREVLLSHFLLSSTDSLFFTICILQSHFYTHYANITIIFRYSKLSPIKLRSSGWFELWTQPLTTYPSCTSNSAAAESDSQQRAATTLTVLLLLEGRLSVSCQWCEAGGSVEYFDLSLTVMSSSGSFT